jgi:hypothetical protein
VEKVSNQESCHIATPRAVNTEHSNTLAAHSCCNAASTHLQIGLPSALDSPFSDNGPGGSAEFTCNAHWQASDAMNCILGVLVRCMFTA